MPRTTKQLRLLAEYVIGANEAIVMAYSAIAGLATKEFGRKGRNSVDMKRVHDAEIVLEPMIRRFVELQEAVINGRQRSRRRSR